MSQASVDISSLLVADEEVVGLSIPTVLGDGYLCRVNVIYRNVRKSVLENGYTFTTDHSDHLWRSYQVMSLVCLDEIISEKRFPCFPNKLVLSRLQSSSPLSITLPTHFLLLSLTLNNHFHEASHALGYQVLSKQHPLSGLTTSPSLLRVWDSLLTEAVASTVEFFAWMFSRSTLERFFLKLNSPSSYEDHDLRVFGNYALEQYGVEFMFERVFLSFFVARLFPDLLSERKQSELSSIFAADTIDTQMSRLSGILLRTAKGLRGEYRDVVAPAYFEILGLHDEYAEVVSRGLDLATYGHSLRRYARSCSVVVCQNGDREIS